MTDNDWRNARIEEAAKAIAGLDNVNSFHLEKARAVLAVFEKALGEATATPTDADEVISEREVLDILLAHKKADIAAFNICCTCGYRGTTVSRKGDFERHVTDRLAEFLLAEGFRRSKVPEPSADPAPSGWRSSPTEAEPDRIVRDPQGEPWVQYSPAFESTRDAYEWGQGEPSDASTCEHCGGTSWHHAVECFTDAPSDAQEAVTRLENCLANREAGIGAWSMVRPEDVRTVLSALRAAGGV